MDATPRSGSTAEPALIYDGGERWTHAQHAAEAYDYAQRADALQQMSDADYDHGTRNHFERLDIAAARADNRAQWHATMAIYEALRAGIAR